MEPISRIKITRLRTNESFLFHVVPPDMPVFPLSPAVFQKRHLSVRCLGSQWIIPYILPD